MEQMNDVVLLIGLIGIIRTILIIIITDNNISTDVFLVILTTLVLILLKRDIIFRLLEL